MIVIMFFLWYVVVNFFVVLCIGGVIGFFHWCFGGYVGEDEFVMKWLIYKDLNG